MKTTVDTIAARELALYAENDGYLYRQMAQPIIANLARKMRKNQYDAQKAVKAWEHFATAAAHKYCRDFGSPNENYFCMFNAATRREAAAQLEESYREQVEYKAKEAH